MTLPSLILRDKPSGQALAVYVTPKWIRQKLHRYDARQRQEGSRQRSDLRAHYYFLEDDSRWVSFNFSTGKIKTVQEPTWLPLFDQDKTLGGPQ
jgi:hypothetical protein